MSVWGHRELPEDRVQAWVDGWWPENDENVEGTGLSVSDLRDVLAELKAHRQALKDIEQVLIFKGELSSDKLTRIGHIIDPSSKPQPLDGFDPHTVKGIL